VIAVFGQTVNHKFITFDDAQYVSENPYVNRGLTAEGIAWAITTYHASNWHPLTWLSHALDCQFYGVKPGGQHLTSMLLHAAAAAVLFLALRRMTKAIWPSAWVAAVFAIHPLRVESVAWVAERKDVLSGLFFMLTLWFYARYTERPESWGRYWLVLASFALGLTAKPTLVTLPFVLLLLDYWPLRRLGAGSEEQAGYPGYPLVGRGSVSGGASSEAVENHDERIQGLNSERNPLSSQRFSSLSFEDSPGGSQEDEVNLPWRDRPVVRLVIEKIPLFVLAAASCLVTLAAQHGAMRSLQQMALPWRIAHAAVAYVAYLEKMLYPAGLAVFYPLAKGPPPASEVVVAAIVLLTISAAVLILRRKCPYLLFGWLWYLGTLVPMIGLVQVGDQAMADRYTYLTQIGLYMAIAWGAADVAGGWPNLRWALAALSVLMVAGLMACAWQQARRWRDSETLFTHTLACTSQNYIAYYCLGVVSFRHGQFDDAISDYRKALDFNPDYPDAHCYLGNGLARRGQVGEAIEHYQKALDINPDYADAHYNLGIALAGQGKIDEAIVHYRKALEINPDYVDVHNNLGNALARRGQVDEAITQYRKALKILPDDADAHYNLGNALVGRGQLDEAIVHYRKVLELKPDYIDVHYKLGNALVGRGQLDEAIAHYLFFLDIKPNNVEVHCNLAVALARHGQRDEAIAQYRKALDLASARNDRALAEVIRSRIRRLQTGAASGKAP